MVLLSRTVPLTEVWQMCTYVKYSENIVTVFRNFTVILNSMAADLILLSRQWQHNKSSFMAYEFKYITF